VTIDILPEARDDLLAGFQFYERQAPGLGRYFRDSLFEDIESLTFTAALTRSCLDIIGV